MSNLLNPPPPSTAAQATKPTLLSIVEKDIGVQAQPIAAAISKFRVNGWGALAAIAVANIVGVMFHF